jgi:hypothetical protein
MARINGVRGWLLVLALVLIVYQPLSLALDVSASLDALSIRGVPLAIGLVARVVVASVGVAAGLALVGRRPIAVPMAKSALVLSAAMDVLEYTTHIFPSNRVPGTALPLAAVSVLFYSGWIAYLIKSRRVRRTFDDE